ncbi:hypothetical protein BDW62DRAFT_220828 [Aspergillus aurantiobrunneus]
MEAQEIQLTAPHVHRIFLGPDGETYSEPLSGSLTVTVASASVRSSGYPEVGVCVTRTVTFNQQCYNTDRRCYPGLFEGLRQRRRSWQDKSSPSIRRQIPHSSTETIIARGDVWHTPDHMEHDQRGMVALKFNFVIPTPADLPPTMETVLGAVSYSIVATSASTCPGRTATATRPVEIRRPAVPVHPRIIQHVRTFLGDRIQLRLDLTPKDPSPGARGKTSYVAGMSAKQTITDGPRASEKRHVVVKELNWRVDETVKLLSINSCCEGQDTINCQEQCVRQLCRGRQTGRWSATGGRRVTDATDDTVEISFEISIPPGSTTTGPAAVEDVDMTAYNLDIGNRCLHQGRCECRVQQTSAIIASHQVTLDVITGEDTIDQVTGRLVDRKPLWKCFHASFPLPVYKFVSPREIPFPISLSNETPPMYDEALNPPSYEAH